MKYQDINIEDIYEQGECYISQTVLDELGFNDLDLDNLRKNH